GEDESNMRSRSIGPPSPAHDSRPRGIDAGRFGDSGAMTGGITDWIPGLHGWVALAIVFLIPALEASVFLGFIFPGEIAVILGGVLAFEGRIPLAGAILAAVLGAFVGDTIGFEVGRRWGDGFIARVSRLPVVGKHAEKHLGSARDYLNRKGGRAVVIGRFTAAFRVMVPGLAGIS